MKPLKYNINSWHCRLYMSTYGMNKIWELPTNICTYFWLLLVAIIMFIPSYIGHLFNKFYDREYNEFTAIYYAFHIPIFMIFGIFGMIFLKTLEGHPLFVLSILYLMGLLVIGILALVVICVVYIVEYIEDKDWSKKKRKIYKHKKPNPIAEGFKSFRGKYCSKIEWK